MKKFSLLLTFTIGLCSVMAAPINSQTALRVAGNFWKGITSQVANIELVQNVPFTQMYIFHVNETEGFVIVSADDQAYPILAYGTDDVAGEMGPETRFWLGQYEREIEALATGTIRNDDPVLADYIARTWNSLLAGPWVEPKSGNMVPAMLTTRWNQSPYYNYYCPTNCPAGCVATAMAQVMKFWNHPIKGSWSHSYNTPYGTLSANFDTTYYDWDNMPNSLSSSSTMEQVHAVALLSYHVGIAVEMNYATDGSGASLVGYGSGASGVSALQNYFGYSSTTRGVYKNYYTDAEWIYMLKTELDMGRPILYAGYDASAGHAFVFDGYNSSSQFHVNWGWGGAYNGFYAMGALNPGGGGVGSNTSNTFNSTNQAILGIEPQPRLGAHPSSFSFPVNGGSRSITVTSTTGNLSDWTATSSAPWLTVSPTTGAGNGASTTVSVMANPHVDNPVTDYSATITLVQGDETVVIPVYEYRCQLEDMCDLTVNAYDRSGNGWNGGFLTLESTTGAVYGTMKLADGSYGIRQFSVCPDTVLAIWHRGSADSDCGFFVENANGIVWVNHETGTPLADADTFIIASPCATTGGFDPVYYSLTATSNDTTRGFIEGASEEIAFGESVSLTARANEGYRFSRWNDGSTLNPRTFTVVADRSLTARFDNLGSDTLHYDNGTYSAAYGGESETHWAIRIPASELVGHTSLQKVKFYNVRSDYYTLNIHQGDTPKHNNMVYTTTFYQSRQTRYRWVEKSLDSAIVLDYSKPLWVALHYTTDGAPAVVSTWCGNDDGSWYSDNGVNWTTLSNQGINATWMLRAYMPVDPNEYTLTVSTNNKRWGTATGGGVYRYGQGATLVATPSEGYHFARWNDNNTENPRTYYVTGNQMIRAIFAEGEAGIENAMPDNVVMYVEGRTLFVRGAEGHKIYVYDALGRQVYGADNHQALSIALPAAGVYVVRYDNQAIRKVVASH